jgi:hypothetical protein
MYLYTVKKWRVKSTPDTTFVAAFLAVGAGPLEYLPPYYTQKGFPTLDIVSIYISGSNGARFEIIIKF